MYIQADNNYTCSQLDLTYNVISIDHKYLLMILYWVVYKVAGWEFS